VATKKLWQSATVEAWALATAREAIIRPLAEAEKLNQHLISDAIQKLGLTRAMVYRLIARFRQRPQASSLLTGKAGRKLRSYTFRPMWKPSFRTLSNLFIFNDKSHV